MAQNKNTRRGIVPAYDIKLGNPNDFCCLNDDGSDPNADPIDINLSGVTIDLSGVTVTTTDVEFKQVCIELSGGAVIQKLQRIENSGGSEVVTYYELDAVTIYNTDGSLPGGADVVPCTQSGTIISSTSQPC